MNNILKLSIISGLLVLKPALSFAQSIGGRIIDKSTKEPLISATVQVAGTGTAAVTDMDGRFEIKGLSSEGKYTLFVKYLFYKDLTLTDVPSGAVLTIEMEEDAEQLEGANVASVLRSNTELAMLREIKGSSLIISNISSQEIKRTPDSNAGEVIRRIPGVSIIDDKFVMVRGLSQRYNNVWINGGAVPSSEPDSRAFSFDIVPSSQIDNLTIVKVMDAEYPSDYTGGFIIINTKEIPEENSGGISFGYNYNSCSSFRDFSSPLSSLRQLRGGINADLAPLPGGGADLNSEGLDNEWRLRTIRPIGDIKASADYSRSWNAKGNKIGLIATANFTSGYKTYMGMLNNLFGIYDAANDKSNYLRHSIDDQYSHNLRFGAMCNATWLTRDGRNKFRFKNIFNLLETDKYTWRRGVSAQANMEKSAEYYRRSRATYNSQITGYHVFSINELNWNAGYSYSNSILPDRRRYLIDDSIENDVYALNTGNDVSREWIRLDEHISSLNVNDVQSMEIAGISPKLKTGLYGEYRTRKYTTRDFIYNWNPGDNSLPDNFKHMDVPALLSDSQYFGEDALHLLEQVHMRNNYSSNNILGAAYASIHLPIKKLDINAGLRYEYNRMTLISNTRDYEPSPSERAYVNSDLFLSLSATYRINEKHQFRFSYGRSVNRPEFRELSSSVYYDFDLASSVQGNTELQNCYVDNIDLRYEYYPSKAEQISLALFNKQFVSPIEWTYTVAGGTDLVYSYKNALSANNYGLELDIRKDLSFIGLYGLNWSFNGALISSHVRFEPGSKEQDRPMQGQSPYLVNTGLFYRNEKLKIGAALLYNRIGKRIIGVGRSEGTSGSDENAKVPDSYEMPRDDVDLTLSKGFGKYLELKCSLRNIVNGPVLYAQFADVIFPNGTQKQVEQIVRKYYPGRNIELTLAVRF
jgi:hypothetical protein